MTFGDALLETVKGKRIAREAWVDGESYGYIEGETLVIFTNGALHTWVVRDADIQAEDWKVISQAN